MEIYAEGSCKMSVCVGNGAERGEIERLANVKRPTGIMSRWTISAEPFFATGETNPCLNDRHPEDRIHYLLEC